ncbi:hypothetical protein RND81_05G036000 [Saponaria officinalis]|uniref:Uncharacterized protein n=1 Tax=Saponaria officinalis TaxID=3572 RepID=A0AAW1KX43_SAPOF
MSLLSVVRCCCMFRLSTVTAIVGVSYCLVLSGCNYSFLSPLLFFFCYLHEIYRNLVSSTHYVLVIWHMMDNFSHRHVFVSACLFFGKSRGWTKCPFEYRSKKIIAKTGHIRLNLRWVKYQ